MGTKATYQGFPLFALRFSRTRGYRPSGAIMQIAVDSFPTGFDFKTPKPGDLATPKAKPGVVVDSTLATADTPSGPAPLAKAFDYEGWLVMSETVGGTTWEHPPVRLFVTSVATVRQANAGRAVVEVRAYDVRYHYDRGWARRHSYNRKRPDGSIALDSVDEQGNPVNRKQIAADVCSALFRSPRLSRAPADWLTDTSSVQFVPNSAPIVNLAQLVNAAELVEPCLFLDESVGLFRPGEGMVGYAKAPGEPNSQAFPSELLLYKEGSGQADVAELNYPEDYVIVAGGLKVVSVAIDDAVPVLDIDGATIEINDENVRFLTGGRFDTTWLRRFVFLPADFSGGPDLPEPVARAFREQAYRLWQVRGVERDVLADPDQPEGARRFVRVAGPNAHLLPLLPMAETIAGRRLPPALETYTFAQRHRALKGGGQLARQQAALQELARIRREATAAANLAGNRDPFSGARVTGNALTGEAELSPGGVLTPEARKELARAGIDPSELNQWVQQARLAERIGEESGAGFGQQYETALRERLAAEDDATGGSSQRLYELAKKFLEFEKKANDQGSIEDSTFQAFKKLGLDGALEDEIRAVSREAQLRREERERRRAVGGGEGADVPSMVVFVNVARTVDAGARVYSSERGIFESSGLAGHLESLEVHDLSHPAAQLSVCPVRTVFGATLRPRLDVPYRTTPRPRTGDDPEEGESVGDCPGGDDVVPAALEDSECYYLAAFKRGPSGGAVPVSLAEIPAGQGLVVRRPDLVELVPLEGNSNRAVLDQEAAKVAADIFRVKPLVRSSKVTVARPWPVNCDGVVESVEIVLRPTGAGFETTVVSGAGSLSDTGGTREDPARRGAAALKAQNEAARREGASS